MAVKFRSGGAGGGGGSETDATFTEEAELDDALALTVTLPDDEAQLDDALAVNVSLTDEAAMADGVADAQASGDFSEDLDLNDGGTLTLEVLSPEESWIGRPGGLLSPAGNNDQTQLQLHGLATAERDIYIKFPTSSLTPVNAANVTSATLNIFQTNGLLLDVGGGEIHTIASGDEGWDETTISKANGPASTGSAQTFTIGAASGDKSVALNATLLAHLESRIDAGTDTTFLIRTGLLGVLLRSFQSSDAGFSAFDTVADALSPVTQLRLGESSGSFSDTGSAGLTVTEVGTVTRNASGLITNEAGDDGSISDPGSASANYVHVGDNYDFTSGDFSVVAWVRMDADTGSRGFVFKRAARDSGNGWSLFFNGSTGVFQAAVTNGLTTINAVGGTTDVGAGVTYMVGLGFENPGGLSARTLTVYLNGISDGSGSGLADPPNTSSDCRVADRQDDEVDEVLIFNKLLTDAEWASLFDAGTNAGDSNGPRLTLAMDLT